MLFSNQVDRFKQNVVIIFLVLVVYAPNVLLHNDEIASNAIDQSKQNASVKKEMPFVEYYIEHNVSQRDAKRSFFEIGIKLLDEKPLRWCMQCTDQIINYCLSGKMLDDHCCCDSRHGQEQIPWIPHSCYVGERCRASVGSCINYTEIRECCCDRVLAKRWKTIYSSGTMTAVNVFTQLICGIFFFALRSFY
ncbi:uncharacterized protein LOC129569087 isoform X1 [Sitodiplosis mosellana]|uniref:uncharacterized protein LOC129569087 isoform X1 n=1 Tax=Sitodiplosis mosellana TaxID=263140 RepID=UPI002444839B|nr:uncharacterized protein LOC129569087 isoform X1 [Sitodiplosis mosellana]XP_055303475.1 uncharacterized protein LOC129569087 isoform X1 [Sitodiplosis mosellana]